MSAQQFTSMLALTCRELQRTRFVWLVAGVTLAGIGLGEFAAGLAVTESGAYRATIYAGFVRLALVFVAGLYVTSSVVRDFDDRLLELVLSRPIRRGTWYAAKFAGYAAAGALAAAVAALPLLAESDGLGLLCWTAALACELLIVIAAALAFAVSLRHVPAAFSALIGFYLLARSMAGIVLSSTSATIDPAAPANRIIAWLVAALAMLLPDFSRFTLSAWLVYEPPLVTEFGSIAIQTALYCALLLAVGLVDFHRKEL